MPPPPDTRVMPSNLEAERSVFGTILLDNNALGDAAATLGADDFYGEAHGLTATIRSKDRHSARSVNGHGRD